MNRQTMVGAGLVTVALCMGVWGLAAAAVYDTTPFKDTPNEKPAVIGTFMEFYGAGYSTTGLHEGIDLAVPSGTIGAKFYPPMDSGGLKVIAQIDDWVLVEPHRGTKSGSALEYQNGYVPHLLIGHLSMGSVGQGDYYLESEFFGAAELDETNQVAVHIELAMSPLALPLGKKFPDTSLRHPLLENFPESAFELDCGSPTPDPPVADYTVVSEGVEYTLQVAFPSGDSGNGIKGITGLDLKIDGEVVDGFRFDKFHKKDDPRVLEPIWSDYYADTSGHFMEVNPTIVYRALWKVSSVPEDWEAHVVVFNDCFDDAYESQLRSPSTVAMIARVDCNWGKSGYPVIAWKLNSTTRVKELRILRRSSDREAGQLIWSYSRDETGGIDAVGSVIDRAWLTSSPVQYRLVALTMDGATEESEWTSLGQASNATDTIHVYPNPSRDGHIAFEIHNACGQESMMRLYDDRGRLVRTMGRKGETEVTRFQWDGKDQRGTPVASGVYFALIERGGQKRATRVAILR